MRKYIFEIWFLGSESEYSAEEEDDDFEEEESDSGMEDFLLKRKRNILLFRCIWKFGNWWRIGQKLEWTGRRSKKRLIKFIEFFQSIFFILLADAEKIDYESDHGDRSKKKGGGASSKKHSPVRSKKRPAHSPPATNSKKKKR